MRDSYRNAVLGSRPRYPRMLHTNPRNAAENTFPESKPNRSKRNGLICNGIASSPEY